MSVLPPIMRFLRRQWRVCADREGVAQMMKVLPPTVRLLPPALRVSRRHKGTGVDNEGVCAENEGLRR
jgi:hypothetical protein